MTSRRTNFNPSATINPRLAYPPHHSLSSTHFPSPPSPHLSSPLDHFSPYDEHFLIDDAHDPWRFENPLQPLPNTFQITRVTGTTRPFEGAITAIGAAQLPDFASLLARPGSRIHGFHAVLLNDPRTQEILNGQWTTPAAQPIQEANSRLSYNDQTKALQKLRKEIYNPLRRISPTMNLYYRGTVVDSEKERNDNGKSCAICLEDFEPKQEVMLTPCSHMFHEECIVPWIKSNGRCPICRFGISD